MATYLFVVDPEEYDADIVTKNYRGQWSCCKNTADGDRALVYVAGKGIACEWDLKSPVIKNRKWKYMCGVRKLRSLDPPITIQEIREAIPRNTWAAPYTNFRGYRAINIPDRALEILLNQR